MPTVPPRYVTTGTVYSGGMGTVEIFDDSVLERRVAIKFMQPGLHRRRIVDELAALLKMRSKHVVQVYDVLYEASGEIGIIQEYVDGNDLFSPYSPPTSSQQYCKLLWQIAAGISDIHRLGVIHRDVKPNNMKVDSEGIIKLFDFGLARHEGVGAATIGFVGTPGFAAPELYSGTVTFTNAVDVYAFGATALFLATGTLPTELLSSPPVTAPSGYFASVGLPLATEIISILDACLSGNPASRPTMVSVRDVLARHLLFDRHQALVVFQGKPSYLNASTRSVVLELAAVGVIQIDYDGLYFRVAAVTGEVFINNRGVAVNDLLPGCCVVALGGPQRRSERKFITFDLSHPEIVL